MTLAHIDPIIVAGLLAAEVAIAWIMIGHYEDRIVAWLNGVANRTKNRDAGTLVDADDSTETIAWFWSNDGWVPGTLVINRQDTVECSGLTARWCPNCGDCTCQPIEGVRAEGPADDPSCPLHSPTSPHGLWRR